MKKHLCISLCCLASLPCIGHAQVSVVQPGYGCTKENTLFEATRLYQEDREAAESLMRKNVRSGECVVFSAGEPVFVTGSGVVVKARRKGDSQSYYTTASVVR